MTITALDGRTCITDRTLADAVHAVQKDAGIGDSVRTVKLAAAVDHAMQDYLIGEGYSSDSRTVELAAMRVGRTMLASRPAHEQVCNVEVSFDQRGHGPHINLVMSKTTAKELLQGLKDVLEPPAGDPVPMPGAPKKENEE